MTGEPVQIVLVPGSRLEQLLSQREAAIAARDAAAERLDMINNGIKAEVICHRPEGAAVIDIPGGQHGPALRCSWKPGTWIIDSPRLKKEDLETWARYAKQKKGYWDLRKLDGERSS